MSYLCTTKNGNDEKMYFRALGQDYLLVKIVNKNDKVTTRHIVTQDIFNKKYQPLIKDQLNHNYRLEFWESL